MEGTASTTSVAPSILWARIQQHCRKERPMPSIVPSVFWSSTPGSYLPNIVFLLLNRKLRSYQDPVAPSSLHSISLIDLSLPCHETDRPLLSKVNPTPLSSRLMKARVEIILCGRHRGHYFLLVREGEGRRQEQIEACELEDIKVNGRHSTTVLL
jgi:hypothetical protein